MVASLPIDPSTVAAIRRTVVVIDDGVDLVDSIVMLLEIEGYCAYGATDPLEGLALAIRKRPDVVVLDFEMPVIDGGEVGRRLRSEPTLACTKILLSSGTSEAIVSRSFRGYDAYLAKPVAPEHFLRTVATLAGP